MPPTREVVSELVEVLKTLHEPITVQELCEHCKKFHGRPDKVKQGLQELETNGMVENIEDQYMLTVNITEQIRHKWIMQVFNRRENVQSKRKLSDCATYAEAIKRESAPGDLVGACGSDLVGASGSRSFGAGSSDTTDHKDYKRSVSDTSLVPGPSRNRTQATVLQKDQPHQVVEQTVINQHQTVVNHHQTIVEQQHHHHHHYHQNITYSPQHNHHNEIKYSPQYNQCEINTSYDRHHHVNQSGDNACLQIGNQNEANFQTVQARHGKKKQRKH